MADRSWGFRTRAIHAGARPDPTTGARAVPIVQSTSFVFEDAADAADLFALQKYGPIYSRISNPTVNAFEERVASLDGGIGAVATASGQSAEFLVDHPAVSWVCWPGLPDHPDHERARRYLPLGPGAVVSFGVVGGRDAGRRFVESVELCSHLANIGDVRTLVIHPASTTHQQLSDDALAAAGVGPDLIRLSVGLEDPDDILWDLDQALNAAMKADGT